jgi:hypothetical protein
MPRQTMVTLGGQAYSVQARPIGEAAAWRRRLAEPFGALSEALLSLQSDTAVIEVGALIGTLQHSLLDSMEILLDLLCEFAPAIAADRARIEAEAYDDEVVKAFVGVLNLVYPFGDLLRSVSGGVRTPTRTQPS